ncbi:MAG TPA: serine/threonine-protein kinase [Polyangiaceae bacterium]|nr:serine/threonine-protein kinase [Polyangiaceae bacterium]
MGATEGQLFAGKYRVERVLGRGGMGVVIAARHLLLDELVAIKFLLPEALQSAEAVARFEREARAAVKIRSEHVARVTDVARLENGAPYMVMELLRGRDLAALLRDQGPLPLTDVADYLLQAGEAIAEAHALGIVHRDLKPPNLFLTQRADGSPCVKVLDFGISKLTAASASADQVMTSTQAVMGSPLYMSPEQLMSARDVDLRTDIWALGVICFELLTGKLPFEGETLPRLCMSINLAAPKSVRAHRPDIPYEVDDMLLRCLSKDPAKRLANVAEFAAELVKFAPHHAQLSAERIERLARPAGFSSSLPEVRPAAPDSVTSAQLPNLTFGEFSQTSRRPSSNTLRWAAGGLGMLLLVGTAAAFAWSRSAITPKLESATLTSPRSAAPLPPPVAPSAAEVPAADVPAPVTASAPAVMPDPTPPSSSVTPPSTPASPAQAAVRARAVPTAGPRQATTPTAAVQQPARVVPPAATDCKIPYFYDSRGNKVFKKACL